MSDNDHIITGCPSIFPHELPGGFDGVEPGSEKRNHVRNCDKYKTAKDAFTGFKEMCADKHCDRCPFSSGRNECSSCKLNWLYAEVDKEEKK